MIPVRAIFDASSGFLSPNFLATKTFEPTPIPRDQLFINTKFSEVALAIAAEKNLELIIQPAENSEFPAGTTGDWSDHAAFKAAGIPYVYFESTDWALGEKDGYTQVDVKLGEKGEIWHTQYDTLDYISTNFPDRIGNRLKTFSTVTEELLQEDMSKL
jgi:hypothetical protein